MGANGILQLALFDDQASMPRQAEAAWNDLREQLYGMNWSSASEREQVRRTSFSVASIASQHDEEARQAETIKLFSQKEVLDARILRAAMLTLVPHSVMSAYSVR